MPLYEYACRECDTVFDARRPMAEADDPLTCPSGHDRVVRRLSVFATTRDTARGGAPAASAAPCGPACACDPG